MSQQAVGSPASSRPPLPPPVLERETPLLRRSADAGESRTGHDSSSTARTYVPLFSLLTPLEERSHQSTAQTRPQSQRLLDIRDETEAEESEPLLATQERAAATTPSPAGPTGSLGSRHSTATTTSSVATGLWTCLVRLHKEVCEAYRQDMVPERAPQRFTAAQRARMHRYESVDAYEPETTLLKDHLETRSHEPRWFIWVFVVTLGLASSFLAILVVNTLHVLQRVRFEVFFAGLEGRLLSPKSYSAGTLRDIVTGQNAPLLTVASPSFWLGLTGLLLFSFVCAALASLVAAVAPESVGAGIPEVLAYFNGISFFPVMASTRVLIAKVLLVILTTASGVCGAGPYGPLMFTGAMLGAQALRRRRWVRFQNIHFVDCFRNPRDERIVLMVGAAAGLAAILSVSIGGLLVVMEVITTVFPTHFALYVFVACLVSCLSVQSYFSYMSYFDVRDRNATAAVLDGLNHHHNTTSTASSMSVSTGAPHAFRLFSSVAVLFHTELPFGEQVGMNVFQFLPAVFLGVVCGWLSAVHIRLSWLSLHLRRRLEVALGSKRLVRFALPVGFTLFSVTLQLLLVMGVFTGRVGERIDGCVALPSSVETTRNVSSIGFYGLNGYLCSGVDSRTPADTSTDAPSSLSASSSLASSGGGTGDGDGPVSPRVHGYASLAFANADSALQTLLALRAPDLLSASALFVFFVVYFNLSAVYSGLALSLDTVLPPMVMGASLGRLVGLGMQAMVRAVQAKARQASAASPLRGGTWTSCGLVDRLLSAGTASSWADPGVFALIGAGSFLSGTSGFTFAVAAILMETTGDFHHLLPLMIGISLSRKTTELLTHDFHSVYLAMRSVPILNVGKRVHKLAMFDARHVMASDNAALQDSSKFPVRAFFTVTTLREVVSAMQDTSHNAFPVVSVTDTTYKGLITRRQLELLLWYVNLGGGGGGTRPKVDHTPQPSTRGAAELPRHTSSRKGSLPFSPALAVTPTYEVLCRRLPDFLYHERLRRNEDSWRTMLPDTERDSRTRHHHLSPFTEAELDHKVLDLSPYLDPSALSVRDSTTLPRVYDLFTTLGLRHLVVVNAQNHVVGILTRKDLTADSIMRRIGAVNANRIRLHGGGGGSGDAAPSSDSQPPSPTALEAMLLAGEPSEMSEYLLVPPASVGDRAPTSATVAVLPTADVGCGSHLLACMPLHPHPAQIAASLRYRRQVVSEGVL